MGYSFDVEKVGRTYLISFGVSWRRRVWMLSSNSHGNKSSENDELFN